jgi:hypothetical protein
LSGTRGFFLENVFFPKVLQRLSPEKRKKLSLFILQNRLPSKANPMKLQLNMKNKTSLIIAGVCLVLVAGVVYLFVTRNTVRKCRSKYGLCPAAKCVQDPNNKNQGICDCQVAEGDNYTYGNKSCDDLKPYLGDNGEEYIYSTFSPILTEQGYDTILCPSSGVMLNCMNKKCVVDKDDKKKATCTCDITPDSNSWVTLNKIGSKSRCTYLSGAPIDMEVALTNFINK